MLELAAVADDRRLAEALRPLRPDAERGEAALGQEVAQFDADLDERREVLLVAPGERIGDDGAGDGAPRRRRHRLAHLDAGLVRLDQDLADVGAHQRCPSQTLMPSGVRPPTRSWMRAPVVITST